MNEITIKIKDVLENGIEFDLYVDGKEKDTVSIGEYNEETYKWMCQFMAAAVGGRLVRIRVPETKSTSKNVKKR